MLAERLGGMKDKRKEKRKENMLVLVLVFWKDEPMVAMMAVSKVHVMDESWAVDLVGQ